MERDYGICCKRGLDDSSSQLIKCRSPESNVTVGNWWRTNYFSFITRLSWTLDSDVSVSRVGHYLWTMTGITDHCLHCLELHLGKHCRGVRRRRRFGGRKKESRFDRLRGAGTPVSPFLPARLPVSECWVVVRGAVTWNHFRVFRRSRVTLGRGAARILWHILSLSV